ncbi:MAG: glutamate-1-semialdehyde 2,1-aminomutase [Tannerella sp.]|jgi:glutamate-1-semialdehyde 2,1-aminomutase|nr:glutamate-1-semialdehyde 2,1-aminomutase [Tannerella sp.]
MNPDRTASRQAWLEAIDRIPGGVNSPVRALRAVGETPLFVERADGVRIFDIDGNCFTDFCLSWGVFILGYNHPSVAGAVQQAVARGTSYGIPTVHETTLARLVNSHIPSMEKLRFVNSGTEAVMSAVRLARGYTGRDLIVKFDGCYHGHADHLLVSAGSGVASLGKSSSAGVPDSFAALTVSLPFNDIDAVDCLFRTKGDRIAAIIVEPVPANMGVVLPGDGFLSRLREITLQYGALLVFDEVITGFRLSAGGAQQLFGLTPDLTTVGKIVGGGFPAAAFGGRADIMALLAPDGEVYQAGTLSGNPVAMCAGIETLRVLSGDGFYRRLETKSDAFLSALRESIRDKDAVLNSTGSMFTLFFGVDRVHSFDDAKKADRERFARFFRYMLAHDFYISPSPFEAHFLSAAHGEDELSRFVDTVAAFRG